MFFPHCSTAYGVPWPGIRCELQLQPTLRLWQRWILLTYCARLGIKSASCCCRDFTDPNVLQQELQMFQFLEFYNPRKCFKSFFISFFFFFFFFLFSGGTAPLAHGGSQPRGLTGARATIAGLHHSHSNSGSKPLLQPTPQLKATPDL